MNMVALAVFSIYVFYNSICYIDIYEITYWKKNIKTFINYQIFFSIETIKFKWPI